MTDSSYLETLRSRLAAIDTQIGRAERRQDEGTLTDRVEAAGDLALLQARRREIAERLEQAEAHGAADWSSFHAELMRDLDSLADALGRWFSTH